MNKRGANAVQDGECRRHRRAEGVQDQAQLPRLGAWAGNRAGGPGLEGLRLAPVPLTEGALDDPMGGPGPLCGVAGDELIARRQGARRDADACGQGQAPGAVSLCVAAGLEEARRARLRGNQLVEGRGAQLAGPRLHPLRQPGPDELPAVVGEDSDLGPVAGGRNLRHADEVRPGEDAHCVARRVEPWHGPSGLHILLLEEPFAQVGQLIGGIHAIGGDAIRRRERARAQRIGQDWGQVDRRVHMGDARTCEAPPRGAKGLTGIVQ